MLHTAREIDDADTPPRPVTAYPGPRNGGLMDAVQHAINEHDYVALTQAAAKTDEAGSWPAGTTGTVVIDYGEKKLVEISNRGLILDVVEVPEPALELARKHS
jgi:hypothetical protein